MITTMTQQLAASAREHRAFGVWWFFIALVTSLIVVWMLNAYSTTAAWFAAIILIGFSLAPWAALYSLKSPRRSVHPPPEPGQGDYDAWKRDASNLGRLLLYQEENAWLTQESRVFLKSACQDLRETLRAHPLSDDLERICLRIRREIIPQAKAAGWRAMWPALQKMQEAYEQRQAKAHTPGERMQVLREMTGGAAAMASRICMSRLLEGERVMCMMDCAWVAAYTLQGGTASVSPIALSAALVLEWSDFSIPWDPAVARQQALARLNAPAEAVEDVPKRDVTLPETAPFEIPLVISEKKYKRVRVRKHKHHRSRWRHHSGAPSIGDIFVSFGQWIRYSIRSWWLNR
jgi:hypothetical protein